MSSRIERYERQGLAFDVVDAGPLDGPAILLLHGWPQRSSSWAEVTPILNEAGFRTLAPDQRGYSPGARPRGRRAYRIGHLVDDAAALVERLGRPVHLVGHDWGAAVGSVLAARRPDLVLSLVSVSVPHPAPFLRALRGAAQLSKSWYMALFQLPGLPERLLAGQRGEAALRKSGFTDEMVERHRREIVAHGAQRGGFNWYRAIPFENLRRIMSERIGVPTTHVWSDGDVALSRRSADLAGSAVVGSPYQLEVLEGVSHWVPEEAPERLAEIILRRVRS